MYIDGNYLLTGTQSAPTQAITVTAASTNVIDLVNNRDMGIGDLDLCIMCVVTTTFVGAGLTLNTQLQGSTDNVTYTTYAESGTFPVATLVQGAYLAAFDLPRVAPGTALPRYLRLNFVASGTFTAGAVEGAFVIDRQDNVYYAPGIIVNN